MPDFATVYRFLLVSFRTLFWAGGGDFTVLCSLWTKLAETKQREYVRWRRSALGTFLRALLLSGQVSTMSSRRYINSWNGPKLVLCVWLFAMPIKAAMSSTSVRANHSKPVTSKCLAVHTRTLELDCYHLLWRRQNKPCPKNASLYLHCNDTTTYFKITSSHTLSSLIKNIAVINTHFSSPW